MDKCVEERQLLANEFLQCRKAIIALGDETRQSILMTLLMSEKIGCRVGEITERTHLSRPAVSHHLQILKDAEAVGSSPVTSTMKNARKSAILRDLRAFLFWHLFRKKT